MFPHHSTRDASFLPQKADAKALQVYAELRRESAVSQGMPVAVRHLESIIRMSEAHAAMHMRDYVAEPDVNAAIRYATLVCVGLMSAAASECMMG